MPSTRYPDYPSHQGVWRRWIHLNLTSSTTFLHLSCTSESGCLTGDYWSWQGWAHFDNDNTDQDKNSTRLRPATVRTVWCVSELRGGQEHCTRAGASFAHIASFPAPPGFEIEMMPLIWFLEICWAIKVASHGAHQQLGFTASWTKHYTRSAIPATTQ